eukprot:6821262-Karenia_brevis.AAC.1
MSRELYNSGAWPRLNATEQRKLHSNVMRVYRSACAEHFMETESMKTDQNLIDDHGLMSPYTHIRWARLTLSVRVATKASSPLLAVLYAARKSARSWLHALEDDLAWIATFREDAPCTVAA